MRIKSTLRAYVDFVILTLGTDVQTMMSTILACFQ